MPYIDLRLGFLILMEYCSPTNEAECIEEDRVNPRYFDLGVGEHELPDLPMVASCHFDLVSWSLFIAPEAAYIVASKMPHLRKVEMHLSDMETRNPALRIKLREGFSQSLSLVPHTMVDFEVYYARLIPRDHSYVSASIIPSNEQHDPLSQALFNISQREDFIRFSAKGSFDLKMMGMSETVLSASWPKLENYEIGLLGRHPVWTVVSCSFHHQRT
ncbi:hypothetical protein EDB82DRAFT_501801 [Fusarium venenatum]|uniref:uncharacterized protein n=1 Tax=Fusarium venenatum TaxID=56646 RepID=UPI001DE62674|nr:hypothetical protein EDB82DRAFT_501801 [Fusarium venenatum]